MRREPRHSAALDRRHQGTGDIAVHLPREVSQPQRIAAECRTSLQMLCVDAATSLERRCDREHKTELVTRRDGLRDQCAEGVIRRREKLHHIPDGSFVELRVVNQCAEFGIHGRFRILPC